MADDGEVKKEAWPNGPSPVWIPDILARIAMFISSNEIACTWRLVDKATAAQFSHYTTLKISLPTPHEAFKEHWGAPGALPPYTLQQRKKFLGLTAASGFIENMIVALEAAGCTLSSALVAAAAGAGHVHMCFWLREQGCPWDWRAVDAAAEAGLMPICDALLAEGCPWDDTVLYTALAAGHLQLTNDLSHHPELHQPPWGRNRDRMELRGAAAEGCGLQELQAVERALQSNERFAPILGDWQKEQILAYACRSPTPDWRAKVEWLEGQDYPRAVSACTSAASRPDAVDRLGWLHLRGYPMDMSAVTAAARAGNVPALQYLLGELRVRVDRPEPAVVAAEAGHLAALQALHAHGSLRAPFYTMQAATRHGHVEVVAWLVEAFAVPEEDIRAQLEDEATVAGSVPLMVWLRERGCVLDTFMPAVRAGCEEALDWLVAQGCPLPDPPSLGYYAAAANGDTSTLRWLHRAGWTKEPHCDRRADPGKPYEPAARGGYVDVLRCLDRELGFPWSPTRDTVTAWVRGRYPLASVRWLVEEAGCPVDWEAVGGAMAAVADEETRAWLQAERQRQERE